jgi:phosphate acetyltransferase
MIVQSAGRDSVPEVSQTIEELRVGQTTSLTRNFDCGQLKAWGSATGECVSCGEGGLGIIVAMLSGLASSRLPGPGSVLQSVAIKLRRPIRAGDRIEARLTVKDKQIADKNVLLDALCTDADGNTIAAGTLETLAPPEALPLKASHSLDKLLEDCAALPAMTTGIVWPLSEESLAGAMKSADAGLIDPILYGPKDSLQRLASQTGIDLNHLQIEEASDPDEAAAKAVLAAAAGRLKALMKGSLHTDTLLHAVLHKDAKLTTGRLMSHCALISAPTYSQRIVLSDVALNIAPSVDQKRDICQNAIGFALAMGISEPRVAVLSAVELVETRMASTLDAAVLAKMADRGQIVGAIVDGPLDLDAAVDPEAARVKHINSPIAGRANVLIVPNIEAGNMVYKEFAFMADAQTAGLVVGARVPVILTSRADSAAAHRFSAAAAVLYANALARDSAAILPAAKE